MEKNKKEGLVWGVENSGSCFSCNQCWPRGKKIPPCLIYMAFSALAFSVCFYFFSLDK